MNCERPALRNLTALLTCALLSACVTDNTIRRIRPDDTTWIQRGETTREQVKEKFGEPRLTLAGREGDQGQYAEYSSSPSIHTYGERGGSQVFVPIPQGPFPQVYPSSEQAGLPNRQLQPLGDRFWLRYNAQGIVEDFGFGSGTGGNAQ